LVSAAARYIGVHAHDIYLEWLADSGALGFLSLVWLSSSLIRAALPRFAENAGHDRLWALAFAAALVAWFAHGLLDDFYRYTPTLVAFWLIAGLAVGCFRSAGSDPAYPAEHPRAG
jgi:O-antigen ligase